MKMLWFAAALFSVLGAPNFAAEKDQDWVVLFDGRSVDHWRAYQRQDFPTKGWKVENGALRAIPTGEVVDIITKEKYGNFELALEWKTAPGANSGIIYNVSEEFAAPWHTGPEYQVLDDARHADGKSPLTSAGSLYALIAPRNKELKPVGEWNTARIVKQGAHVEHWLNGKKVVEFELGSPELKKLIAKSKFADLPKFAQLDGGHIVLQHHHDDVSFRNIKIRPLSAGEKSAGWKTLFDGQSTAQWRGFRKQSFPENGWVAENGVLKLEAKSKPGDLISKDAYSEFDLRWDWRIPRGANNGLKYFIIEERGAIGHEYQMIDDDATRSAPKHKTASFYDVLPPSGDAPVKIGEWNHSRILVQGSTVQHWLNGEKVLEYELGSPELLAAVQKSKFKSVPGFGTKVKGHLVLTDHSDQVEYRNIRILPLD